MSLTLQREAVLKNACAVVPRSNSNFGLEEGLEAEADRRAACEGFMGGLLKGGEYAGMRFFLQLSRTYALRSSRDPHGSPVVSCVGKGALTSLFARLIAPGGQCSHVHGLRMLPHRE